MHEGYEAHCAMNTLGNWSITGREKRERNEIEFPHCQGYDNVHDVYEADSMLNTDSRIYQLPEEKENLMRFNFLTVKASSDAYEGNAV